MSDDVKDPLMAEVMPEDDRVDNGEGPGPSPDAEADLLRDELGSAQMALTAAKAEADDFKSKWLRARAELETYRRRASADVERAREAGMDSALLTVLSVYDDLGRALKAAAEATDPATIIPGVRSVRESLERNLDTLGMKRVGEVGETFNPDVHEALTAVPTNNPAQAGTIADVFEVGFVKGERLVRPARVVVYQE